MTKLFKNLLIISLFSFFVLSPLQSVYATSNIATQLKAAAGGAGYAETQQTPTAIVMGIVKVALSLIGTVFLILIIYAGILWMTAGGNDEQITKATKMLTRSFIGLVIIISSYSISLFAERLVRGGSGGTSVCVDTPTGGKCCKGDPCWDDPTSWGVGNY